MGLVEAEFFDRYPELQDIFEGLFEGIEIICCYLEIESIGLIWGGDRSSSRHGYNMAAILPKRPSLF